MANVFLSVAQYKKMPEAEIERIRKELEMNEYKPFLEGFHPMFDQSVQDLVNYGGHKIRYSIIKGDGNLPRARSFNFGIWRHEYDNPELRCEYMMIVDDDLSFPSDAIDRLIQADKPIIGGVYTFKSSDPAYIGKACTRFFENQELREDRPIEVKWLNGGFILIKAEVLLNMVNEYPSLAIDIPTETEVEARGTWALWCPMVKEDLGQRLLLSEDWAFCDRARSIGYDIWADLSIRLIHWNAENGFAISV